MVIAASSGKRTAFSTSVETREVCKRPWACPRGLTAFALLSAIDQ